MRTIATTLAAMLAVLLGASAFGQSPSFAQVCESQTIPTRAEYDSNPGAYADNFCALATYAPHRAARQFNSMIALVRAHNNPNRFYWDPRIEPGRDYIQLLRPWMAEQGWWIGHQYNLDRNDSFRTIANVYYFTADQRGLSVRDRGYSIHLLLDVPSYYGGSGVSSYRARFSWGDDQQHFETLYVDRIGDTQQWRFRLGRGGETQMTADLIRAGVHFALDCLSDTVVFHTGAEDCDTIIDFGSSGSSGEQVLAVADDGALAISPTDPATKD